MAQVVVSLVNQVASDIAVGAADEHILHVSIGPHLGGAIRLEISHRGAPRTGRPPTFRRLVTPGTRQMGLSLCAAVVEAAGGTLELHSSSSGGSRLGVILPAAPEGSLPSTAPWETSSDPGDQPVPRARVLVVDDDELVAAVFKAALDRHDVTVCQSGRLAIEALAAEEFDAVVCDLMMPDTSGIDVWEAVQLVSPERARRMLFLTGGAFTDRARTFVAQQAERVLYKPVRAAELRRAVEAVLAGTPIPHPAPPRD
jgi:CheY-like chemotaxis protein